jgi:hypothetical protein
MSVISTVLLLPLFAWGGSWPGVGGAAHRRARRRDRPRWPGPTRPLPARSGPCPALAVPGRGEQTSVSSLLWDSPADRDRHGAPLMPPSTTNTHRRQGVFRGPSVRQVVGQPAAGAENLVRATRPANICRSCRRRKPVFGRGTAQDRPVRAPGRSGTLEPPPVRDKNGLRRLRTVTA